jgi:hypothetical protein
LATTETLLATEVRNKQPGPAFALVPLSVTAALTFVALLVHGYHPYAEDGGVYLPGVLKLVHPQLFPTWNGFVTAQTRFSLFAPAVAALVRFSRIGVMIWMFVVYLLSIWTTLYAAWQITARCWEDRFAPFAAVSVLALCLTTPIAGTSLMLMDPYVTARSISTPCMLFAIVAALDLLAGFTLTAAISPGRLLLCGVCLLTAALMHPLMAAYAAGCVILLVCASLRNIRLRTAAFAAVAFLSVAVACLLNAIALPEPAGYRSIALTRDYWFLAAWHWYEILGMFAPLLLLLAIHRYCKNLNERGRWLVRMAIAAGLIGLIVALLFARVSARSYFVAMLQPLRIFQAVYIVMLLLAGAVLGSAFLQRRPFRWFATFASLAILMALIQMTTFRCSAHIEVPWLAPRNDWERGFLWIRNNTPADATFALDANHINCRGEDTQNFRAIAQRSSLPDDAKDGGIAAIEPGLTSTWLSGEVIQDHLAKIRDAKKKSRLASVHVSWLVLPAESRTNLPCPYQNRSMKVCRIPHP